jgi:small subunit ribosomal protein S16
VAVKLRLMRMGKTKQPTYRVVAADSRSPRDGRFIEILGVYAPRGRSTKDPDAVVEIDNDKVVKWLKQGAQPTDRVERLLKRSGAMDQFRGVAPAAAPAPEATTVAATAAAPATSASSAEGSEPTS